MWCLLYTVLLLLLTTTVVMTTSKQPDSDKKYKYNYRRGDYSTYTVEKGEIDCDVCDFCDVFCCLSCDVLSTVASMKHIHEVKI